MTPEELLKPRYKVIAEFPKCRYTIGELLPCDSSWMFEVFPENYFDEDYLKKYPHLFRKLEWWEERKPEDMPMYLKSGRGKIEKAEKWEWDNDEEVENELFFTTNKNSLGYYPHQGFLPATEEEYKNQKP